MTLLEGAVGRWVLVAPSLLTNYYLDLVYRSALWAIHVHAQNI